LGYGLALWVSKFAAQRRNLQGQCVQLAEQCTHGNAEEESQRHQRTASRRAQQQAGHGTTQDEQWDHCRVTRARRPSAVLTVRRWVAIPAGSMLTADGDSTVAAPPWAAYDSRTVDS
jgi:hypothetical protein